VAGKPLPKVQRPPKDDHAKLEAFVRGEPATASAKAAPRAEKPKRERKQVTVYFQPEVLERLLTYCARQRMHAKARGPEAEMSSVVGRAVSEFLDRQER